MCMGKWSEKMFVLVSTIVLKSIHVLLCDAFSMNLLKNPHRTKKTKSKVAMGKAQKQADKNWKGHGPPG